jgi:hypothetical protein
MLYRRAFARTIALFREGTNHGEDTNGGKVVPSFRQWHHQAFAVIARHEAISLSIFFRH